MKKLFIKGLISLLVTILITICLISFSVVKKNNIYDKVNLLTDSARYHNIGIDEINGLDNCVDAVTDKTKVIFGDSVAAQLFSNPENIYEDYYLAIGLQAMTFVWQYIFIDKYIEYHPETSDVYMVVTSDSLSSVIQPQLSYQYFLMPLVKYGLYNELDDETIELAKEVYGEVLLDERIMLTICESGILRKLCMYYIDEKYKDSTNNKNPEIISYIPATYLMRIYKMCKEKGVEFHLIPCPVKDIPENRKIIKSLEKNYLNSEIGKLYPDYFKGIVYYPENQFKDALHFKDELLTDEYKEEIINSMKSVISDFE